MTCETRATLAELGGCVLREALTQKTALWDSTLWPIWPLATRVWPREDSVCAWRCLCKGLLCSQPVDSKRSEPRHMYKSQPACAFPSCVQPLCLIAIYLVTVFVGRFTCWCLTVLKRLISLRYCNTPDHSFDILLCFEHASLSLSLTHVTTTTGETPLAHSRFE